MLYKQYKEIIHEIEATIHRNIRIPSPISWVGWVEELSYPYKFKSYDYSANYFKKAMIVKTVPTTVKAPRMMLRHKSWNESLVAAFSWRSIDSVRLLTKTAESAPLIYSCNLLPGCACVLRALTNSEGFMSVYLLMSSSLMLVVMPSNYLINKFSLLNQKT